MKGLWRRGLNHAPLARSGLFDILLAVPLALLALPVVALAAVLIKLIDPGPAFYVQKAHRIPGNDRGNAQAANHVRGKRSPAAGASQQ
jgi:hypothetical protein